MMLTNNEGGRLCRDGYTHSLCSWFSWAFFPKRALGSPSGRKTRSTGVLLPVPEGNTNNHSSADFALEDFFIKIK